MAEATFLVNAWQVFFDRIESQVTTVTTGQSTAFTVQTYTSSFPDKQTNSQSSYPIIVVKPVNKEWDAPSKSFTFTKKFSLAEIEIEVYCTNSEATDLFMDKIINAIQTHRTTFNTNKFDFLQLEGTEYESEERDGFKIHVRRCTFSFRFPFTRSFT